MMKFKLNRKLKWRMGSLVVLGTLCFAGTAHAQGRQCTPVEVGVFSNRIHVKCAPISGKAYTADIPYYAMTLNNRTQYVLDILIAAKANKRPLYIWFNADEYKSVPGCQGNNCRKLTGVALR